MEARVYKNRIVSAPMAFSLVAQNPIAAEVFPSENWKDRQKAEMLGRHPRERLILTSGMPCVFLDSDLLTLQSPKRIWKPSMPSRPMQTESKSMIALHWQSWFTAAKKRCPLTMSRKPIGPVACVNSAGVPVRAMTKEDMDRIANDFAVAAVYMQKAGFDGVLVHGGHGSHLHPVPFPSRRIPVPMSMAALSENRGRFPIQICKAIREAVGPDFLFELRIDGTDHQPGGITPEETGKFVQMVEQYLTSVHITCGVVCGIRQIRYRVQHVP